MEKGYRYECIDTNAKMLYEFVTKDEDYVVAILICNIPYTNFSAYFYTKEVSEDGNLLPADYFSTVKIFV